MKKSNLTLSEKAEGYRRAISAKPALFKASGYRFDLFISIGIKPVRSVRYPVSSDRIFDNAIR